MTSPNHTPGPERTGLADAGRLWPIPVFLFLISFSPRDLSAQSAQRVHACSGALSRGILLRGLYKKKANSSLGAAAFKETDSLCKAGREWGKLFCLCQAYEIVFEDFKSHADGLPYQKYRRFRGLFHGACGEGAFRLYERTHEPAKLLAAVRQLSISRKAEKDPVRIFLLGKALEHLARSKHRGEAGWDTEIKAYWTIWEAFNLLTTRAGTPDVINGQSAAGAALPVGRHLLQRLMTAAESNTHQPGRVHELVPLMRITADRFRYLNQGEAPVRARGRGKDGPQLDRRFDVRPMESMVKRNFVGFFSATRRRRPRDTTPSWPKVLPDCCTPRITTTKTPQRESIGTWACGSGTST